jgi:hypothetical protein
MHIQLHIELNDTNPKVWRRLKVPADYSLYQLHLAIQGAFGWHNCHLFQFSESGLLTDKLAYGLPDPEFETESFKMKDARTTKMNRILRKPGQQFSYEYDFGDSWMHLVTLEGIFSEEISRPWCEDGYGTCPPEDCGGTGGYQQMLSVFATPRHPDKKSYLDWLGLPKNYKWDPHACSVREINARLALLDNWHLKL